MQRFGGGLRLAGACVVVKNEFRSRKLVASQRNNVEPACRVRVRWDGAGRREKRIKFSVEVSPRAIQSSRLPPKVNVSDCIRTATQSPSFAPLFLFVRRWGDDCLALLLRSAPRRRGGPDLARFSSTVAAICRNNSRSGSGSISGKRSKSR